MDLSENQFWHLVHKVWAMIVSLVQFSHSAAAAKSLQSCPTLCDPIDGSPPGSLVTGILQARTLEWVAISFSNAWKWKVKVKSVVSDSLQPHGLKPTRLLCPWDFPGKSTGVGCHCLLHSAAQLCPNLYDPMGCSMPGFPVHHQLWELNQTHIHQVGDAIQTSHPLSSTSHPAFNLFLFSNESILHTRWPKYWSFSISPSNEYSGLISFTID